MASKRSGERPTGKGTPASRPCLMGQRPHPMVLQIPKDDRDWPVWHASLKDVSGQPEIPADRSGYREERDGSDVSHRLQVTAEGISVNVGGPGGEGCRPPMKRLGVGGAIGTQRTGKPSTWGRAPGDGHSPGLIAAQCSMNVESTHAGAAVNAKGMTSPAVTLGAEGRSLESPVLGNGHAGFGRGSGETQCGCAPCSYLTNPHLRRLPMSGDTLHH